MEPCRADREDRPTGLRAEVTTLHPSRWPVLRSLRLRALQDSPSAFGSEYRHEVGWSADVWAREFESSVWVVARDGDTEVGLARSVKEVEGAEHRNIESVWVAPRHRRLGICRMMLSRLVELERTAGASELRAWILKGNVTARNAYLRFGFVLTGEQQPCLGANGRLEERVSYRIGETNAAE
jgi:L-amino acid N-acyltransferase YncA